VFKTLSIALTEFLVFWATDTKSRMAFQSKMYIFSANILTVVNCMKTKMKMCLHAWQKSRTTQKIDGSPFQIEIDVIYCPKCEKITPSVPYLTFNKSLSHEQQLKFFNIKPKQKDSS